jgi:hypothetical protein
LLLDRSPRSAAFEQHANGSTACVRCEWRGEQEKAPSQKGRHLCAHLPSPPQARAAIV